MQPLPDLPLKDRLALDRTLLANDRTWLATARTAIALFVTGASFLRFFDILWLDVAGVIFVLASLPVVAVGWRRYRLQHRELVRLAHEAAQVVEEKAVGELPGRARPPAS